jgi:hypothetical protein
MDRREQLFLMMLGRHMYGLSPEDETHAVRWWFVLGGLVGLMAGGLMLR